MDLAAVLYGRLDRSWQAQANCMGVDPDLFFPERGASTREAKEVCRGCVVREDCLEYALANGEKFGIWGGMSAGPGRCNAGPLCPTFPQRRVSQPRLEAVTGRHSQLGESVFGRARQDRRWYQPDQLGLFDAGPGE